MLVLDTLRLFFFFFSKYWEMRLNSEASLELNNKPFEKVFGLLSLSYVQLGINFLVDLYILKRDSFSQCMLRSFFFFLDRFFRMIVERKISTLSISSSNESWNRVSSSFSTRTSSLLLFYSVQTTIPKTFDHPIPSVAIYPFFTLISSVFFHLSRTPKHSHQLLVPTAVMYVPLEL